MNLYADTKGYPQVSLPLSSIVLGEFNTKINNSGILEYSPSCSFLERAIG